MRKHVISLRPDDLERAKELYGGVRENRGSWNPLSYIPRGAFTKFGMEACALLLGILATSFLPVCHSRNKKYEIGSLDTITHTLDEGERLFNLLNKSRALTKVLDKCLCCFFYRV